MGIIQFCVSVLFIRYLWVGLWSGYVIFKKVRGSPDNTLMQQNKGNPYDMEAA